MKEYQITDVKSWMHIWISESECVLQVRRSSHAKQTNKKWKISRLQTQRVNTSPHGKSSMSWLAKGWKLVSRSTKEMTLHHRYTLTSEKDLFGEWKEYFSSLLNNSRNQLTLALPPPAAQDLPILTNQPIRERRRPLNPAVILCRGTHQSCATQPVDHRCQCTFTKEGRA